MSAVSEAFDALSVPERVALLVALEFEAPERYAEWDERDTRYMCLWYEVQSELNACYRRSGWDAGAGVVYRAAHHAPAPSKKPARSAASEAARAEIASAIKDFSLTISRG